MLLLRILKNLKNLVSISSREPNVICSMAGRYKGIHVDKISVLKEAGIAAFYNAKRISKDVSMLVELQ